MKILFVNKFLFPNGGSETYIFKLGEYLQSQGHTVEYFGMEHQGRCVGNHAGAYTTDMDFHGGSRLSKLTYPIKTIYSVEARKKIRLVLEDMEPDVVHLNNFNYQLTPSVILEVVKYRRKTGRAVKIVYTAHDYQLVCPGHLMNNPITHNNCELCLGGHFVNCVKNRCIHGSRAKSIIGMLEAKYWNTRNTYKYIDTIICCTKFMQVRMNSNPIFAERSVTLLNFTETPPRKQVQKKDYVLYFGRFSEEKGILTLIEACKKLSDIQFIFAGTGPLVEKLAGISNIENVGYKKGEELETLIREARFSVCPSECYENCPFSVLESISYGTPVIGARIGGIPELIENGKTGLLFISRDKDDLYRKIQELWSDSKKMDEFSENCLNTKFDSVAEYTEKLMKYYK